jgi:hypothetical protein
MTNGERMVWAATYAVNYVKEMSTQWEHCCGARSNAEYTKLRDEAEEVAIHSAIESASCAVRHLRDAEPEIREGWGEDSDVFKMAEEMLTPGHLGS